jgi:hypothetical protein
MKPNDYHHHFPYAIDAEIDRAEFAERVSNEIMEALHSPGANIPIGAISQWADMTRIERMNFVKAGLECFYWIYIARRSEKTHPCWQNIAIDQRVETAASFCSFMLGIEFEDTGNDEILQLDSFSTGWVN